MLKQILIITLSVMIVSTTASCQADQINLPTATSELVELPTQARTEETKPSSAPLCFTPADLIPISFTPDNTMLAIRAGSGVQLFSLETMREESFLQAPQNVLSAALSPDGQTIAWSLEDNTIQLIQVPSGRLMNTLEGHTDIVSKLRFSPSGDKLLSASHDGSVRVWDSKGNLLQAMEVGSEVVGIGISFDGTRLATVPFDGPLEVWDLTTYQKVAAPGGTGGFDTSDAVFSPEGKYLAADLATGLFLWRLSDGKLLWDDHKNSLAVAFSPDGQFLAYSNVDNNQIVLSSPDGAETLRTLEGLQGTVWELFFSPDSSLLAATDGREIRIWNAGNGNLLYRGKAACP